MTVREQFLTSAFRQLGEAPEPIRQDEPVMSSAARERKKQRDDYTHAALAYYAAIGLFELTGDLAQYERAMAFCTKANKAAKRIRLAYDARLAQQELAQARGQAFVAARARDGARTR